MTVLLQTQANQLSSCIADFKRTDNSVKCHPMQSQSVSEISSALSTQMPQRGVKRTRKSHNKVRTGCLTCKIRRKKCDETKPACTRCTSTGRKCDGYPVVEVQATKSPCEVQEASPRVDSNPVVGQKSFVYVVDEPRVYELHADNESVNELVDVNDNFNETEVTDFILSYAAGATAIETLGDSTLSSPWPASSATSPSHNSRSPLSSNQRYLATSILPRSPNFFPSSTEITSIEASCFSYFKHVTGPSFASYFDSSMWRTYAINAALAHPVVFSAATALGAVHQRFNFGISREAFEYCGHAARLHARAVKQLEDLKNQHVNVGLVGTNSSGGHGMGVYDRDVIMTCEMLLGLFEGFQQNYVEAVTHINNGMKYLLARPMTLVHSETRYCTVESKTNVFRQLFDQLERRALQLFGSEVKILVNWDDGLPMPVIPDMFADLDEARDFLFTEVDWIMRAPTEAWADQQDRSEAQNLHVERLMKWSVSYAETVKNMERTPGQKLACKLMKLTRNATHLLLFMTLFATVDFELPKVSNLDKGMARYPAQNRGLVHTTQALWEMVQNRDYLATNLARVKILAESILDDESLFHYDEHSVSFDSAIGPPRRNDKMPDSSNKTRHLVKIFLKQNARSSTLWEMLGVYGVAEKVSAVEEHAVIAAIKDIIPEHLDPRWVDITCLMENRKILLRYCRPDDHGLGMMWTQEWWAF